MTTAQDYKYFRRWTAVVRANNWRMSDCRLVPEALRSNAGEHHAAVWAIAEKIAGQECRAVIPDDLRHACHIHACGRDLPHKRMSNDQFNRLLILWGDERDFPGLLIEPDHIASIMAWDNPAEARRQGQISYLRKLAPANVVAAVALDAGFGDDWEGLQLKELLDLGFLLRKRGCRHNRGEVYDRNNAPF
jgi:hypothetical protein